MNPDAPAPTRRGRRASATGEVGTGLDETGLAGTGEDGTGRDEATDAAGASITDTLPGTAPSAGPTGAPTRTALAWVDPQVIGRDGAGGQHPSPLGGDAADTGPAAVVPAATAAAPAAPALRSRAAAPPDLLAGAPRRSPFRPSTLVPIGVLGALAGAYAATTLLWPLHAVAPEIVATEVLPVAAPAAAPAWPGVGSAAIAVEGIGTALSSSADARSIASITKVVTALVVLDEMPLALGEQGPAYQFTSRDRTSYLGYLNNGESALNVPVGGSLSEYQLLEGMLIGSANNYADRLASTIWPSDAVFSAAANDWLAAHGVPEVTIVDPTGIELGNRAAPQALIALAQRALADPVVAEIVAKPSTELPGPGRVENTNSLLADPGVLGIKTGSLDAFNLLSAKQVQVGDTAVRLYASVLGQPDDASRDAASRALYAQLEAELQLRPSVLAGTKVGTVRTEWGQSVDIVTDADATVVLWNGATAVVSTIFDLGDSRGSGDDVGTVSVTGPLDGADVAAHLTADIEPPDAWWRLTHPLALFGLD